MSMFPTTGTAPANLAEGLTQSKVDTSTANAGGVAFLQFSGRTGEWVFGRDKEDVGGEEIIINSYSFVHGWALWVDGQVSKRSASFVEPLPEAMPSATNRRGQEVHPSQLRGFQGRFIDDEDTILSYEGNSYGARQAVDTLLSEVTARAAKGETEYLFPRVRLDDTSYETKEGNKVYNPVLTVLGWVNQEGEPEPDARTKKLAAKEDAKAEPETPEKEQEQEAEPAAPKRRRRRAAAAE